jgi:signal transduction histidine kinase
VRVLPSSLQSRLAVLFALGSAAVLLLFTLALYRVLDHQLLAAIDSGLRSRAADLSVEAANGGGVVPDRDPFAQTLTLDGRVVDQAPAASQRTPVLTPAQLARVGSGRYFVGEVRVLGGDSQLLATPLKVGRTPMVLVVGSSIDGYNRARSRLKAVLLVASPVLVGLLAACGWLLAGAALSPVRRLTAAADGIGPDELDRRLAVPGSNDEIEHLARTINAMLDRIEQAVANERTFIDDASHELRTPISILRGELELALAQPRDEHEVEASLRSALDEAVRLGRLAEDLLALARARSGELHLRRSAVDLAAAARRLVSGLGEGGAPVQVEGEGMAWADPDRVDQILTNLLVNARRHAAGRIQVDVRARRDGTTEIEVADDGPGFAPSMLPVTFERFVRGDPARGRDTGGTGLGLAIVAGLARAQGASIEAGNGGSLPGASVRVTFPAVPQPSAGAAARHGVAGPN